MSDRNYLESLMLLGSMMRQEMMHKDVLIPKVFPFARGTIKPAKFRNGFGFIAPDDKGVDVYFKTDAGRKILAGLTEPEFSDEHLNCPLKDNDRVIYRPQAYVNPGVRSTRQKFQAVVWGFESEYNHAEHLISLRPVYRVTQTTCYNNHPVSNNPDKEIVTGSMEVIKGRFPNGFPKGLMSFTYTYRAEVRDGEKWEIVTDFSLIKSLGLPLPPKLALSGSKTAKHFGSLEIVSV